MYNVSDGASISSTEFIETVARIAGLPPPPQVSMEEAQLTFGDERLSFINESRRVDNERMIRHLGVRLLYADVEEGDQAEPSGRRRLRTQQVGRWQEGCRRSRKAFGKPENSRSLSC